MLAIDSHLHYYDFYDAEKFLKSLSGNLGSVAPGADRAGVVMDRAGMQGYELLVAQAGQMKDASVEADAVVYCSELGTVRVYRGVQVACKERFEILGLFCAAEIEDGIPAKEAIKMIMDVDGVPIVAWAPGKWMFHRRLLVKELLESIDTKDVGLGDTSLRPTIWQEPSLMRKYRTRGGAVLCGSDPLPYSGQENIAGTYASCIRAEEGMDALSAVRSCLAGETENRAGGRRTSIGAFAVRLLKNSRSK